MQNRVILPSGLKYVKLFNILKKVKKMLLKSVILLSRYASQLLKNPYLSTSKTYFSHIFYKIILYCSNMPYLTETQIFFITTAGEIVVI